ncbi:ribonuclease P protein subunit p29 isoform X2 [Lampris incognitus]|uniref:ribonuclease P protein subunit p29 isoform X2 n=1 Tax=Lampris incognitus TaxID=2546036 RepID=UPI0024B562EA|nr:ribonuclease P protein subunit p29 isoform X2 [Lampris incognitus]
MTEASVKIPCPPELGKILGIKTQTTMQAEAFTHAFIANSVPGKGKQCPVDKLAHKAVVLEYARSKKVKEKRKRKKSKGLNAKQKRELKVFQIKPEHQKYELFLPLHDLWKQYIIDLCNGLKPGSNPLSIQQKLLKADFHGAIITVVRSKCPSYVGTTGILVQEFKHVFKIITKEDRMKGSRGCWSLSQQSLGGRRGDTLDRPPGHHRAITFILFN